MGSILVPIVLSRRRRVDQKRCGGISETARGGLMPKRDKIDTQRAAERERERETLSELRCRHSCSRRTRVAVACALAFNAEKMSSDRSAPGTRQSRRCLIRRPLGFYVLSHRRGIEQCLDFSVEQSATNLAPSPRSEQRQSSPYSIKRA